MGFEIEKSAEELQQKAQQFYSDEQIAEEQNAPATPLTDAENQDLTYNLSGEAQTTGFTEQDANSLTESLSGESKNVGDSAKFNTSTEELSAQNTLFSEQSQSKSITNSTIPSYIQFLINKYPDITKVYLRDGIITFVDKNNVIIRDAKGNPLSIDLNNPNYPQEFNLITFFLEQNNGEAEINTITQLSNIQDKFNSSDKEKKEFYNALLSNEELNLIQSMNDENRNVFIANKLINAILNNELPENFIKYISSNTNNNQENSINSKDLRAQINTAATLEELNIFREQIELLSFSSAEKQMLYNECIKRQGQIQANNQPEEPTSKIKLNNQDVNNEENHRKSKVSFELFKKCKTPAQREMANFILSNKKYYFSYENLRAAIDAMIENCKTQEDVKVRQELLEIAIQNPNFIENESLNCNIMQSISNTNTHTCDLQLKIYDTYKQSAENETDKQNNNPCEQLKELSEFNFDNNTPEIMEFCKSIIFDDDLNNDKTTLETLLFVLHSENLNKESLGIIYNILKIKSSKFNAEDIYNAANSFISNETATTEFIINFINDKPKADICKNKEEEILYTLLEDNATIYNEFIDGRNTTNKNLYDLFKHSQYAYEKQLLSTICLDKQYSAENIIDIVKNSSEKTSETAQKVLGKRDLTINEKINILHLIKENDSFTNEINLFLSKDNVNLTKLPKFLSSITTLKQYKIDLGKINPDKIDIYIQMIQNPKTCFWVKEMLNLGWDIETISQLSVTKLKYYAKENYNLADPQDSYEQFLIGLDFNSQETEDIIRVVSRDRIIDKDIKQTIIYMLNAGIPKHQIGNILKSATIIKNYNTKFSTDAIEISHLGLDNFLEKYLMLADTLSKEELVNKLDSNTRITLINMIKTIPESIKTTLRAKGFNIDSTLEKLIAMEYKSKNKQTPNLENKNLTKNENKINKTQKNESEFESRKKELQNLAKNKNYKAILELMGIDVNTLPDGTLEISRYTSYIDKLTLSEYGINENDLLSNVSRIKGDADFKDSNVTSLPKLKNIGGELIFGDNDITDLNNLEEVNKKKIIWDFS